MLNTKRLVRIGIAHSKVQSNWLEGVALERDSGATIEELRLQVAASRFRLAQEMNKQSRYLPTAPLHLHRLTISRSYYAMYHSMRAAAYMFYGGDDHEQHSELPKKLPLDFPEVARWGNQLKSAREYRNQADYDPYPKAVAYWRNVAEIVNVDSMTLLPLARHYLRSRGCRL